VFEDRFDGFCVWLAVVCELWFDGFYVWLAVVCDSGEENF